MKSLLFFLFVLNHLIISSQVSDFKVIDFNRADNIAKLNQGRDLENLPLLAYNLTYKLPTKVEKFRAIYTWVCTNITGDYKQHNKVSKQRKKLKHDSISYIKWNNNYKKTVFKKLKKHKKTMCTGYAYLIKELCFLANIECIIIDGYGRTIDTNIDELELVNHSWNAVKLNNKWYLCDATWSSGYMIGSNIFYKDYNTGYFLTEPLLFAKNHYPVNKKWLLINGSNDISFVNSPIVYNETFTHKIIPCNPEKLNIIIAKNESVHFSFKTLKDISIENVSLVKFNGNNEKQFEIYNLKKTDSLVKFSYLFKRKGIHDVHLKIKNDIVATYTVQVI